MLKNYELYAIATLLGSKAISNDIKNDLIDTLSKNDYYIHKGSVNMASNERYITDKYSQYVCRYFTYDSKE